MNKSIRVSDDFLRRLRVMHEQLSNAYECIISLEEEAEEVDDSDDRTDFEKEMGFPGRKEMARIEEQLRLIRQDRERLAEEKRALEEKCGELELLETIEERPIVVNITINNPADGKGMYTVAMKKPEEELIDGDELRHYTGIQNMPPDVAS